MEEKEEIIYDLENPQNGEESRSEEVREESREESRKEEVGEESGEVQEGCDSDGRPEVQDTGSETEDTPRKELERMVDEMGAETLLSIIKDNRNAAIRQIINEVEASQNRTMPSSVSASMGCSSIFDLAALA